jgi:purine-binding chemotaxis protein CheW
MNGQTMTATVAENVIEYVTATISGQLFGMPIERVRNVFMPDRMTRVPLAAPEVVGLLNLRGRIVTAIDMRRRLDLPTVASAWRSRSNARASSMAY